MIKQYLILLFAFLLIGNKCLSQETEPLNVKRWTLRSMVFTQPYTFERNNPLPSFFTGIGAKVNFEKISYRFSYESINYNNEMQFEKGFKKENTIRVGAEYKKRHYSFIQLNFFVDFVVSKFDQESNVTIQDTVANFFENYDGYATGANIGIGFDYYFKPSFSLSLETRLDLIHISGNISKIDYLNNYTVNYYNSFNELNLNLLGNFSINYHF